MADIEIGAGITIGGGVTLGGSGGGGGGGFSFPATFTYVAQTPFDLMDGIFAFRPDGSSVTMMNGTQLNYYPLNTPWDITSIDYPQTSDISSYLSSPSGAFGPQWNASGTELNVVTTPDYSSYYAAKLTLGTAWNTGSITSGSINATPLSQGRPICAFNADGTKAYQTGSGYVRQYNLGSAYNWYGASGSANASYDLVTNLSLSGTPRQITFSSDGLVGITFDPGASYNGVITQFQLGTPYDISTINAGTAQSTSLSVGMVYADQCGCYLSPDNTKLYIGGQAGFGNPRIYQFSVS